MNNRFSKLRSTLVLLCFALFATTVQSMKRTPQGLTEEEALQRIEEIDRQLGLKRIDITMSEEEAMRVEILKTMFRKMLQDFSPQERADYVQEYKVEAEKEKQKHLRMEPETRFFK